MPIAAVVVWLLVVRGSYRNVEKVLLALSSVFLAYVIAAFLAKPDWGEVLHATVVPQFIPHAGFVLLVIATIGTTIAPWMQFFVQSNIVDKGVERQRPASTAHRRHRRRRRGQHRRVVHHRDHRDRALPARHRSRRAPSRPPLALAPVAGQYASVLFAIGLFGASLLAAFVLPLTAAYAITEAFGWERGIDRTWAEAPVFNAHLHLRHLLRRGVRAHSRRAAHHDHGALAGGQRRAAAVPAHLHDAASSTTAGSWAATSTAASTMCIGWATVVVVIGLTVTLLVMQALGVK